MKFVIALFLSPVLLTAQTDPAVEAYRTWDAEHRGTDYTAPARSLFEISSEWVAKWPDSRTAWRQRRASLIATNNHSPELWKQAGENLIRLSPPHTLASSVAYDWVTARVNVPDAEKLLTSEIAWQDAQRPPDMASPPSLSDLVNRAAFSGRSFSSLCTLASAQIQLKEFDKARATIARISGWLEGDFSRYYDQDPLETFPDYQSHLFRLSGQLAQAEGRNTDAMAFYHYVMTNPYYRREYGRESGETHSLWRQLGGTEDGWAVFSKVPPLPPGVPSGHAGTPFLPWIALDYKLPEMSLPGLDSHVWTIKDFAGKATLVFAWGSQCGAALSFLPAIQRLYDAIKDRRDVQVVALSWDEDPARVAQLMKESNYTFPVMVSKPYMEALLRSVTNGQFWITDNTGHVRLYRTGDFNLVRRPQAFVDEVVYKLGEVSRTGALSGERN